MASTPGMIERLSGGDLVELRSDVGPAPKNVGALLVLDDADAAAVEQALRTRLAGITRLRHRLVAPARVLGPPYWLDEPSFAVRDHVTRVRCPAPADHDALLELAAEALTQPFPPDRPLWRAVVVDGLQDGAVGVVLVMHHVLSDGVGGLSMLAALADPGTPPASHLPPRELGLRPGPSASELLTDRAGRLARAAAALPASLARMRRGRVELGGHRRGAGAPRCSLNVPTGARRRLATVDVDLEEVRTAARRRGATVNDLLLVAVTSAMDAVLRARDEDVAALVVSVPVSARRPTGSGTTGRVGAAGLGNQVGVMRVRVPVRGSLPERLAQVAATTRARRLDDRGASAGLVGPVFRLLVAVGAFRWLIDHQRLVSTFLTNVRGPVDAVTVAGARVRQVAPLTSSPGNVAVTFAALSWAGRLVVTVVVDPDVVADPAVLADATGEALRELVRD
ncbi:wax ester/triacylglycerol synthase domain-containing protein [Cellulomonas timonensis]|uniref:wax ester/triacylglycerol synthase domain-containing protein n=1 Tax=Cellulomonas timonensis TaxID=1689271 RepID=UPI0009ED3913|nr:wax ester/triacylglycerol synthase domain-containing protein [Cellulomonas timonensis]